ncbi:hypothetical protein CGRA01v4_08670 [Colletotrichum graminicola]|nr:hypothetical protein CGRA01v4_08670 [Colletotrichum graminicola]
MKSGPAMLGMQMLGTFLAGIHTGSRLDISYLLTDTPLKVRTQMCRNLAYGSKGSMPLTVKRSCPPHCCLEPSTPLDRSSHKIGGFSDWISHYLCQSINLLLCPPACQRSKGVCVIIMCGRFSSENEFHFEPKYRIKKRRKKLCLRYS